MKAHENAPDYAIRPAVRVSIHGTPRMEYLMLLTGAKVMRRLLVRTAVQVFTNALGVLPKERIRLNQKTDTVLSILDRMTLSDIVC